MNDNSQRRPTIVAHRGFSHLAPENTLAAIRLARAAGADAFEVDLHMTRDGRIVAIHDDTLDRTTDGTGRVAETDFATLRKLDAGAWKSGEYAGEKIPTLEEVVAADRKMGIVLELKAPGIAGRTLNIVERSNALDRTTFIAFNPENLDAIKTRVPRTRLGLLAEGPLDEPGIRRLRETALACGAGIVDLEHAVCDETLAGIFTAGGFAVWVWTVDRAKDFLRPVIRNCAAVATNRPDLLLDLRDGQR